MAQEQLEFAGMDKGRSQYTSLKKTPVVTRLFYRVDEERLRFCVKHDFLPPPRMRQKKLERWIDRRIRRVKNSLQLLVALLPFAI